MILLTLSAGACHVAPPDTTDVPLEQRLGWVNGSCLAIMNNGLQARGAMLVVALDDTPVILTGTIEPAVVFM